MVKTTGIYRILDANLNRLREALRVIEEYFRFIDERPAVCVMLKKARHALVGLERRLDRRALLAGRDTRSDCFASAVRPEELGRAGLADLLTANFRRGQEACRVLEEYAKTAGCAGSPETAKTIRFTLYKLEKDLLGGERGKKGQKR